jgi:hypothetical protein
MQSSSSATSCNSSSSSDVRHATEHSARHAVRVLVLVLITVLALMCCRWVNLMWPRACLCPTLGGTRCTRRAPLTCWPVWHPLTGSTMCTHTGACVLIQQCIWGGGTGVWCFVREQLQGCTQLLRSSTGQAACVLMQWGVMRHGLCMLCCIYCSLNQARAALVGGWAGGV